MKNLFRLAWPLALAACSSSSNLQDADRQDRYLEATELLDAQAIDEALLITDALLRANPDDREALVLAARGNMALFESGRTGQQYFLEDAIGNLERALEIEEQDAESWLQLADLHLKSSDFAAGRDAAVRAAELLQQAEADNSEVARAWIAAADNEMQMFVDARRAELDAGIEPEDGTVQLGQNVLTRLHFAKRGQPGMAYAKSGQVYMWMQQELKALDEYERGLEDVPGDPTLHDAFQGLYANMDKREECIAAYRRLLKSQPGSSLLLWHMARAQYGLADDQRAKGRSEAASATYGAAAETFEKYLEIRADHADAVNHWLALCNLSRARLALDAGNLDDAMAFSAAAFANTPRVAETDENGYPAIIDSFNYHYLGVIDGIGRAITDGSSIQAMGNGLAYYEELIDRHPGQFGFLYNNAAFVARDYAYALESTASRSSSPEEQTALANATYERSYQLYEKAVELSPDDPRVINDCGLILVYHLKRDYDRAQELFERAIAVGQPQLDALPEDTPEDERHLLEEAIGDAYQNIGVMRRDLGRPFEEYEETLRKSLEYYPYRGREASVLLATKGRGRDRTQAAQDPRPGVFAAAKTSAEERAAEADYDGALLVLDGVAAQLKGYAPYHHLVGQYSLAYADQAIQNGGGVGQIDGLLADAVSQLAKAVELNGDPVEPRLELAQAYAKTGDFANASKTADRLLSHIRSLGGADTDVLTAAHTVRAEAASRVYVEKQDAEEVAKARASYRYLEENATLSEQQLQLWSVTEAYAGDKDAEFAVFARGLERSPDSMYLLDRVVELAQTNNNSAQALELLGTREDALGLWFTGRAQFNHSQELWRSGKSGEASEALDRAIAAFEAAKERNADYAASSNQWLSFCLAKRGFIRVQQEALGQAAKDMLAAAEISPGDLETDLGDGRTIKQGIQVVADRFYTAGDLGRTELMFRRAGEIAPEDSLFANNHGLFARDYGTQLERAGETEKAMAMYEASYDAYTRAAEIEPTNVRLINDRALLLLYHLKRDEDLVRELLLQAVELGETQLQDPPTDSMELRNLQEALGDCYQNLGLWEEQFGDDLDAAKAQFEKSLTFYPFETRESTRHLRRVNRKLEARASGGGDDQGGGEGGGERR